jgi:chromosome segregation ATPase
MELLGKKEIDLERHTQETVMTQKAMALAQKVDEERARLTILRDTMKKNVDKMRELYDKEFAELEEKRKSIANEIELLKDERRVYQQPLTEIENRLKQRDVDLSSRELSLNQELERLGVEKERISKEFNRVLALKDNLIDRQSLLEKKEKGLNFSIEHHKTSQDILTRSIQNLNERNVQVDTKLSEGNAKLDEREKALNDREVALKQAEKALELREIRLTDKEQRYGPK